jgi:hypothetical protein
MASVEGITRLASHFPGQHRRGVLLPVDVLGCFGSWVNLESNPKICRFRPERVVDTDVEERYQVEFIRGGSLSR